LVERLLYTQDVGGSSPSPPTSLCSVRAGDMGEVTICAVLAFSGD
jgi:hypothetical protein